MEFPTKSIREIRKEELENYRKDLIKEKTDIEMELSILSESVERTRIRRDVIETILRQHSYSSSTEQFKEMFHNPLYESYQEKKREFDLKTEEYSTRLIYISTIIEQIENLQSK